MRLLPIQNESICVLTCVYLEKGDYNEKTLKEIMQMKMGGVAMHHG